MAVMTIRCVECERPWQEPAERWQARLSYDDELGYYCPDCADREFGDDEG